MWNRMSYPRLDGPHPNLVSRKSTNLWTAAKMLGRFGLTLTDRPEVPVTPGSRREHTTLLGSTTAWLLRAQHREQGRLQNHILFCHKHDYRDAEAIGHRT
jgi:hypothetical protein